jgi:hypothetical protein
MISLAPSPFELWASADGYATARAMSPCPLGQYADSATQDAFRVWNASAVHTAHMITLSTLDTEALQEKLLSIAASE